MDERFITTYNVFKVSIMSILDDLDDGHKLEHLWQSEMALCEFTVASLARSQTCLF